MHRRTLNQSIATNFAQTRLFKHNCYVSRELRWGRRLFFVKVHKCASTSIIATCAAEIYRRRGMPVPDRFPAEVHRQKGEAFAFEDLAGRNLAWMTEQFHHPNTFKFSFVREPIGRVVSAWADKVRRPSATGRRLRAHLGLESHDELSLGEFVERLTTDTTVLDFDHHWRPQVREGAFDILKYDFVGDTTHLQACMDHVFQTVFGRDTAPIVNTRKLIGHRTDSHAHAAALSREHRAALERTFQEDVAFYRQVQLNLTRALGLSYEPRT
ncbi:MAG: sulfotransferase family 2 domain-containing protein [Pseudomonadota bacterium]